MSILLTFLYMVNCSMSPRSGRMEQFTMYKNVNKIRVNQCHCYQRKSLINCSCHFIFSNFFYLTLSFYFNGILSTLFKMLPNESKFKHTNTSLHASVHCALCRSPHIYTQCKHTAMPRDGGNRSPVSV